MGVNYCSLVSGSSGNSHFVYTENTKILIDVGMSNKYITSAITDIGEDASKVDAVFITHEHSDHIQGLRVFMKKHKPTLYVSEKTLSAIEKHVPEGASIVIIEPYMPIQIKDLMVTAFMSNHDAIDPLGYNIQYKDRKISIVTDVGTIDDKVFESLTESDFLVLESNHDVNMLNYGPYPFILKKRILSTIGHLSNDDAAECIKRLYKIGNLRSVLLAHLSKDNNFPELAYLTVKEKLEKDDIVIGRDLHMDILTRDKASTVYRLT